MQFCYLGIVTSIECNHKQVDTARKGQEVCVKIENVPGETPKLYGRHFDETDMLISKVSDFDFGQLRGRIQMRLYVSAWGFCGGRWYKIRASSNSCYGLL